MKALISIILFNWITIFFCPVFGQKKAIDEGAFSNWQGVSNPLISPDGKFVAYGIGSALKDNIILVDADNPIDTAVYTGDSNTAAFSDDGKYFYFKSGAGILNATDLKTKTVRSLGLVDEFKLLGTKGQERLICLSSGILNFMDLSGGNSIAFKEIDKYIISGSNIVGLKKDHSVYKYFINSYSGIQEQFICKTTNPELLTASMDGSYLAYFDLDRNGETVIVHVNLKSGKVLRADNSMLAERGYVISKQELRFNQNGDKLFLQLEAVPSTDETPTNSLSQSTLWHYLDTAILSSRQFRVSQGWDKRSKKYFLAAFSIKTGQIKRIEKTNDYLRLGNIEKCSADFVISRPGDEYDLNNTFFINMPDIPFVVINTTTLERTIVPGTGDRKNVTQGLLAPRENYFLWFDAAKKAYFSFNLKSHQKVNVTKGIKEDLSNGMVHIEPYGVAGWSDNGESVFLYDQFDIWRISLSGKEKPVCVTNGNGRKQQIVFSSLSDDGNDIFLNKNDEDVYLASYQIASKQNGFYRLPGKGGTPVECMMSNALYYLPRTGSSRSAAFYSGEKPIRAKYANTYFVTKGSVAQSPNLFVTKNFQSFKQVSNVASENSYRWLTSELVHWKMDDGKTGQGILYKPEDFDASKSYPLIFDYYETRSDELHKYIQPAYSIARINIPFYVSNGFLVFVPDIIAKPGRSNGESAVNAVVSAARHLSAFPWVDKDRLGLQGHSYGGYNTNYLITHSDLFAAACEVAGTANAISSYGQLTGWGYSRQIGAELGFQGVGFGLGKTPWTDKEIYLKASPVFNCKDVKTPLLIVHNKEDGAVPFEQGGEMYHAMRAAEKRVWMVEYKDQGHSLTGEAAIDFTRKMYGFFLHYLKDEPEPEWMMKSSQKEGLTISGPEHPIDLTSPNIDLGLDKLGERVRLLKPKGWDNTKKYPLLICFNDTLNSNAESSLPDSLCSRLRDKEYGVAVISFAGRTNPLLVLTLVDELMKKFHKEEWIDTLRVGLLGSGNGGYLVNYLISKRKSFKAATEISGISDLLSLDARYHSMFPGAPVSTDDRSFALCPILGVGEINTPLLMFHNKDDQVPFGQGVALFTAMRRAGRRCWMLEDEYRDKVAERVGEFFDHYLRGLTAPEWMLFGNLNVTTPRPGYRVQ